MYLPDKLVQIVEAELKQLPYPAEPVMLYTPISYSLEGGGKRIRPVLTLAACNLFQESIEPALPAALAVEVFHNFTLLHDDIMDQADIRRGKPVVHKKWNSNVAILSGDAMLIYAYRLLAKSSPEILPALLDVFNDVALGVCEGQQYDMDFEAMDEVSVEEYLRMIQLKTAILLAGSLKMGAICGGATPEETDLLYRFGINIGLAFQLQDDLLDTYADADTFGKAIGGDILVGKKTFLLTNALERADVESKAELSSLLKNRELSPDEKIANVRAIYDRLNIRQLTEQAVAGYFECALELLAQLEVVSERLVPLRELAHQLLNREK